MHTIFDSCPEGNGIRAIAITRDAKYLATISDAEIQVFGAASAGWPACHACPREQLAQATWHLWCSQGMSRLRSMLSGLPAVASLTVLCRVNLSYRVAAEAQVTSAAFETSSSSSVCCRLQKVCIWRWTLAAETPACSLDLPKEYGFQVSSVWTCRDQPKLTLRPGHNYFLF